MTHPTRLQASADIPVLHNPKDIDRGIFRLPDGAVSCIFHAADGETRGLFVRFPDGAGAVFPHCTSAESSNGIVDEHGVLHEGFSGIDVDVLDDVPPPQGHTPEARSARLAEIFWKDVNPSLDDPYLLEGILHETPLAFRRGDEESFAQVIRWAVACCPPDRTTKPIEIAFMAEGADEPASINHESLPEGLDVLERIADVVLDHFGPMGEVWEYNDGAYGRQSGYSNYQATFSIVVEPPSAHERLAARSALAAWLRDEAGCGADAVAEILGA
jgi:hypothetical protein